MGVLRVTLSNNPFILLHTIPSKCKHFKHSNNHHQYFSHSLKSSLGVTTSKFGSTCSPPHKVTNPPENSARWTGDNLPSKLPPLLTPRSLRFTTPLLPQAHTCSSTHRHHLLLTSSRDRGSSSKIWQKRRLKLFILVLSKLYYSQNWCYD